MAETTAPEGLSVPLTELKPHPENPRRGNVDMIMASLERFGQVRPIVALPDGTIVAGNHTYEAARRLGMEQIKTHYVDLNPTEARAYLLADNRPNDSATYDDTNLLSILQAIQDQGTLSGTGFSDEDVEDLLAVIEGVKETPMEEFQGGYAEDPELTEARWADRQEGQNREVVYLLPKDDYDRFIEAVQILKRRLGIDSMAQTILHTVLDAAHGPVSATQETDAGMGPGPAGA